MNYTFFKRWFNHLTLMERFYDYNIKERKKHCGWKNKRLTFYVIRPQTEKAGLMSLCNFVAWRIRHAIENDYIPVIDMKNYRNMYLDYHNIGRVNSYEYYFEQPTHFSLEEAYQSYNVIVCDINFKNGYSGIDNHDEIAFLMIC